LSLFGADRPTNDVVLIVLTLTVCAALTIAVAGMVVLKVLYPESDTDAIVTALGHSVLAVLGYIVGRVSSRSKPRIDE
jgi:VIT1/CCC1 family predicted Fe2+/Mn2+ transporter